MGLSSSPQGLPSYFNMLGAWNPNLWTTGTLLPGTLRQAFNQRPQHVNPYLASTSADMAILSSVYDTLFVANPFDNGQLLNWMTVSTNLLCKSAQDCANGLSYQ